MSSQKIDTGGVFFPEGIKAVSFSRYIVCFLKRLASELVNSFLMENKRLL